MKLDRIMAEAVTVNAWLPRPAREGGVLPRTNPATGKVEFTPYRDGATDLQRVILGLMTPIEARQRRGVSEDNLGAVVAQWAGSLARWVKPGRVVKRGQVSVLQLQLSNPGVGQALRPKLPELQAALAKTGIAEVRL